MRGSAVERAAQTRAERRRHRENVDGRLVSTIAPTHGAVWVYLAYSCRCWDCTRVHSAYVAEMRKKRYAGRIKNEDGVWIYPPGPHGSASTYVARGCRCEECTEAARVARTR
jgi:hypothetical protein